MPKFKVKYNGEWIEVGGSSDVNEPQVQSDWDQNDETAVDFIKNKPTLATSEEVKALFN